MNGDENKRSFVIFWVLGIFFIIALIATGILIYSFTLNQIACGKSSANPLFVINTPELPVSNWNEDYSYNIEATLVGARTNLTGSFTSAPAGMKIDPCTVAYNTDVAPTPNSTIKCTLKGLPTVQYTSGFKITGTFAAPDLKKTIQKDFILNVVENPGDYINKPNITP